jgi:UDP-N-acetyl-D-glucosamine dehydrogenase
VLPAEALSGTPQVVSRQPGPSLGPAAPGPAERVDPDRPPRDFRYDVAVVGLGYVGLPTGLQLHAAGRRVVGVDISAQRLAAIRAQDVDLLESDRIRLSEALSDGWGFAVSDSLEAIEDAAAVVVCVPTPVDDHLLPNLRPLRGACEQVVAHAQVGQTLMLTSTTYVGCTKDFLITPLTARGLIVGRDVFVAFAPERINPGDSHFALHEVPRVIGGATAACLSSTMEILSGCSKFLHPVSSIEIAEMTKLYENTFRAVNISLVNEFADISACLKLNISEVIDAAATKPYGFMPFRPGAGIGGHCIPCDPHYLLWQLRAERVNAPMIEAAMTSIANRPGRVVSRSIEVLAAQGRSVKDAEVLVVGVAYKPGVSDVRESPALEFMARLRAAGARVSFTDDLVDSLHLGGEEGEQLVGVAAPQSTHWDLVIVHTTHPDVDLEWLTGQPAVLDTTYRLPPAANCSVL